MAKQFSFYYYYYYYVIVLLYSFNDQPSHVIVTYTTPK